VHVQRHDGERRELARRRRDTDGDVLALAAPPVRRGPGDLRGHDVVADQEGDAAVLVVVDAELHMQVVLVRDRDRAQFTQLGVDCSDLAESDEGRALGAHQETFDRDDLAPCGTPDVPRDEARA
jgi:hypothetical protein